MKSWIATATLIAFTPSLAMSQEFDWSSQLGASLSKFETALGGAALCDRSGFAIPVKTVNPSSVVDPDLFDPIRTTDFKYSFSVPGQRNLNVDEDRDRYFPVGEIKKTACFIDKEATATAFAFNDQIFRIAVRFDRCASRNKSENKLPSTFGSKVTERRCWGADLFEKPFDATLYKQLEERGSYHSNRDELLRQAADEQQLRILGSFYCYLSDEAERVSRHVDDQKRCLIDVDDSDRRKWSAVAMYEFYKPGFTSYMDKPSRHLAANRLFIDLVAEASAFDSVRPGLQKMVDDIKEKIAVRLSEQDAKDGAVSDILGAGN